MASVLLGLARIPNIPTVWTNCIAAWFLAGGSWQPQLLILLCLGASLIYAGGCTLNDAWDSEWDRQFRPERPIPSGRISLRAVWVVGFAELAAGLAVLMAFPAAALWSALLLCLWVLFYDQWHKRSAWAVLLMALCRFQLAATAALATGRDLGGAGMWHAVALFAYILLITGVARFESRQGAPTFPAIRGVELLLLAPAAAAILPAPSGWKHSLPVLVMVLVMAFWLTVAASALKRHGRAGIGPFVGLCLAGISLFDAAFGAIVLQWNAWVLAAFLPLCMLLQRRFAAT
jgi:4-hydroxybenzoate polyprenyltransferase